MKTKMTLLIVVTAIATLSFSFVATKNHQSVDEEAKKSTSDEPIGGLVSEKL